MDKIRPLKAMLSRIYFVKARRDRNKRAEKVAEIKPSQAPVRLYQKFLEYKYFVAPSAPLIITEGVTDRIYLQCAIRSLAADFPALADGDKIKKIKKIKRRINFLKCSGTTRKILGLSKGTSGQAELISRYTTLLEKFSRKPMRYPVIILCDNDQEAKEVFASANKKSNIDREYISIETIETFYHLGDNLYLIKIPEGKPSESRDIEDLFDSSLLNIKLAGKSFDRKKEYDDKSSYGKADFAQKVVRSRQKTIDFSQFAALLSRIEACLKHYENHRVSSLNETEQAARLRSPVSHSPAPHRKPVAGRATSRRPRG